MDVGRWRAGRSGHGLRRSRGVLLPTVGVAGVLTVPLLVALMPEAASGWWPKCLGCSSTSTAFSGAEAFVNAVDAAGYHQSEVVDEAAIPDGSLHDGTHDSRCEMVETVATPGEAVKNDAARVGSHIKGTHDPTREVLGRAAPRCVSRHNRTHDSILEVVEKAAAAQGAGSLWIPTIVVGVAVALFCNFLRRAASIAIGMCRRPLCRRQAEESQEAEWGSPSRLRTMEVEIERFTAAQHRRMGELGSALQQCQIREARAEALARDEAAECQQLRLAAELFADRHQDRTLAEMQVMQRVVEAQAKAERFQMENRSLLHRLEASEAQVLELTQALHRALESREMRDWPTEQRCPLQRLEAQELDRAMSAAGKRDDQVQAMTARHQHERMQWDASSDSSSSSAKKAKALLDGSLRDGLDGTPSNRNLDPGEVAAVREALLQGLGGATASVGGVSYERSRRGLGSGAHTQRGSSRERSSERSSLAFPQGGKQSKGGYETSRSYRAGGIGALHTPRTTPTSGRRY